MCSGLLSKKAKLMTAKIHNVCRLVGRKRPVQTWDTSVWYLWRSMRREYQAVRKGTSNFFSWRGPIEACFLACGRLQKCKSILSAKSKWYYFTKPTKHNVWRRRCQGANKQRFWFLNSDTFSKLQLRPQRRIRLSKSFAWIMFKICFKLRVAPVLNYICLGRDNLE